MTQTLPASLYAPGRQGVIVGYQLLNPDLTQYQAFTISGVSESAPGQYVVSAGVIAPDNGGYIRWAIAAASGGLGEVLAVGVILPAPVLASDNRLSFLDRAISSRMPRSGWPP
jgi:hypothetical protein